MLSPNTGGAMVDKSVKVAETNCVGNEDVVDETDVEVHEDDPTAPAELVVPVEHAEHEVAAIDLSR